MVVVDKRRTCKITDFAIPEDSRIEEKDKEKIKTRMRVSEKL